MAIYEIVKGKKYKIVIEAGRDPATGKRKRITRKVSGRKHDAEMVELELKQQLKRCRARFCKGKVQLLHPGSV